jgi:hypothetical protein
MPIRRAADLRSPHQELEQQLSQDRGQDDDEKDVREGDASQGRRLRRRDEVDPILGVPGDHVEGALVRDKPRRKNEAERPEELQKKRHPDGGDEGGDARGVPQRLVGDPLDRHGQRHADDHGQQDDRRRPDDDDHDARHIREHGGGPHVQLESRHSVETDKRADHEDVTVREIDQFHDAVHRGVSQCDERVHEPELETADHNLEEQTRVTHEGSG